ncbi:MAG TPA: hypothetical protein DCY88_11100 [Cyanobacteria bacterium UBA11372]|nr:hypothetical protein [Cyanobacteria bacterium UBA11372]
MRYQHRAHGGFIGTIRLVSKETCKTRPYDAINQSLPLASELLCLQAITNYQLPITNYQLPITKSPVGWQEKNNCVQLLR